MKTDFLTSFGLTKNDRRVYDALLELGKAKTGAVMKQSGIGSSRVYASLANLAKQGLVSSIVKNNIRYYQPEPPEQLLDASVAQASMLQEFIKSFSIQVPKNSSDRITVYEGVRGYRQAFHNHLLTTPDRSKLQIIGYGSVYRSDHDVRKFFKQVDEDLAMKKCTAEMVMDESLWNTVHKDRKQANLYDFRLLPSRYFSAMAINISPVEVMFTIIGAHPIAICIRDQQIIEAFKKYFKLLWETAKKK